MRRTILSAAAAGLLLVGLAGPAAAASSTPFGWDETYEVGHACDIVERVSLVVTGRAYFDNEGEWQRDILRFHYQSTYENTVTGEALVTRTSQVLEFTPETGTFRGQGTFIRGGEVGGVALPDIGLLVFDADTGSTMFGSAKVLRLDDPDAEAAIEAALCEALG